MPADPVTPTRETRISVNLSDYQEAAGRYRQLMWRAQQEKDAMDRALRNLTALGASEEVEKLNAR